MRDGLVDALRQPLYGAAEAGVRVRQRTAGVYPAVKRCFDLLFSFFASLILLLPMAAIALLIVIKDHGSPIYVQKRVGCCGRELPMAKFRTMKKGADALEKMLTPEQLQEYRREFKLRDDPRLIGYQRPGDGKRCFGGRLRSLSLDELPQIVWNILLKGNMSVVGPRPILAEEMNRYYTAEQRALLLSVKPGLTGYWQAYARNDATYETGKRQEMEMYYIRHQSLWLDMRILAATVGAVIRKRGAR